MARPTRNPSRSWTRLSDEKLLDMRMCDLGVTIEGSELEARVARLYDELAARGLRFRPHCWLSSEWFAPNDVPGIAIPFYLAHPRLKKLEDRMMLEVEGGTRNACMKLLRHEAGHAYETAFRLGRRQKWRRVFGRASRPYPTVYRPRPFSRNYVLHLDWWYAQSHPCEDFAETFAVWLAPASRWRRAYRDWPALKKLQYVDELMGQLAGRAPAVRSRRRVEPLREVRTTLREYYAEKQQRYGSNYPDFYNRDLRRLFPDPPDPARAPAAAAYLRRIAPEMREIVARWTGEYNYTVGLVLKDMIIRCRELDLRVCRPESELKLELAVMLTMQTMNFVYSTDHTVPL
jgi:hypothetical protein